MIAAVSLVEVSVSTLTAFSVRSMTRRNIASRVDASTAASVMNSAINVAMSGSIIPTPLANPTIVTPSTIADATFATVSVVMMPWAAGSTSVSGSGGASDARCARTRSIG